MSLDIVEEIHSTESIASVRSRLSGGRKKLYLETYGCQMNVYDSELVAGIMKDMDYDLIDNYEEADAIFLNTCAIRENAEQRVWGQLTRFKGLKERKPDLIIGVLGCMAKHMEDAIHKKRPYVNVVLGPDSYRKLPELLAPEEQKPISIAIRKADDDFSLSEYRDFHLKEFQIDTRLSRTEVYEDVAPLRFGKVSAWIAIMRGCDNFCTFCVVPYTRGRERSRTIDSVVEETKRAVQNGYSEICLLGQNVNSYRDNGRDFAELMERISDLAGVRRIRFTSPHPKDFPEHLLHLIAERSNICKHVHMPVQSGSNRILDLMNRTYTREEYLSLIEKTRKIIPNVAISTDIITGFPSETEEDHQATLELFEKCGFDFAYMFKYSPRIGTKAYTMPDDVSEEIKSRRMQDILTLQKRSSLEKLQWAVGRTCEVLIEDISRKSDEVYYGRNDKAETVLIPKAALQPGDYVTARISRVEGHSLVGEVV